jgi:hypothetical protein
VEEDTNAQGRKGTEEPKPPEMETKDESEISTKRTVGLQLNIRIRNPFREARGNAGKARHEGRTEIGERLDNTNFQNNDMPGTSPYLKGILLKREEGNKEERDHSTRCHGREKKRYG